MSVSAFGEDPDRIESEAAQTIKAVLFASVFALAFAGLGYVVALVYAAPRQAENREAVTPDTVKVYSPSPQASVDAERDRRYVAEHQRDSLESVLDACMSDRSILQAAQGVTLPRVTSREASR